MSTDINTNGGGGPSTENRTSNRRGSVALGIDISGRRKSTVIDEAQTIKLLIEAPSRRGPVSGAHLPGTGDVSENLMSKHGPLMAEREGNDARIQTPFAFRMGTESVMDYFQQLEEAVTRKKMEMHLSNLPPVMCHEELFTRAVPSHVTSDTYKRSPSNRIATNYSPTAAKLGDTNASIRKVCHPERPIEMDYLSTPFEYKQRWKTSDSNPGAANEKYRKLGQSFRLKASKRSFPDDGYMDGLQQKLFKPDRCTLGGSPLLTTSLLVGDEGSLSKRRKSASAEDSMNGATFVSQNVDEFQYWENKKNSSFSSLIQESITDTRTLEGHQVENMRPQISKLESYQKSRVVGSPRSKAAARVVPLPMSLADITMAAENMLKYEFYLEEGIDKNFISPLRENWLTHASQRIGHHVKTLLSADEYHDVMVHVALEVKYNYLYAMRKAILDYILKDASERKRLNLVNLELVLQALKTGFTDKPTTIQILSQDWRDAVLQSHGALAGTMYRLNVHALEIMELWEQTYENMQFLDVESNEFSQQAPFELLMFENFQKSQATKVRTALIKEWMPMVSEKFELAAPLNMDKKGFLDAMAVLMSNQVRKLVEDSIKCFIRFLARHKADPQDDNKASEGSPVVQHFDSMTVGPTPDKIFKFFGPIKNASDQMSTDNWSPPFLVSLKNMQGHYSVEPSFEELEAMLLGVVDFAVLESSGILRADADKLEPSARTMRHMVTEDELPIVAKNFLRQLMVQQKRQTVEQPSKQTVKPVANLITEILADFEAPKQPVGQTMQQLQEQTAHQITNLIAETSADFE